MSSDKVVSDLMLALWEEVLWLFSGCVGQCRSTHNLYAVESPKGIRAVRRAFLFPFGERADGPLRAGSAGPSIRPPGELLFLFMQKKPAFVPDSEAFNSFIRDGFLVPELKGGSEASEDEQVDNVSNEATHVIGKMDLVTKSLATSNIGRWQRKP